MAQLEIVTHCYCPPNIPWYAEHLRWQFASLCLHRLEEVVWSVCYTPSDIATVRSLEICLAKNKVNHAVKILPISLEPASLFRRAIGRNIRAKATRADVVWFTDVDYSFGPDCLDVAVVRLNECEREENLIFPAHTWISIDHGIGQNMVKQHMQEACPLVTQYKAWFKLRANRTAIGGIQIVLGDYCREHGYLDGTKWVNPVSVDEGFRQCVCDKRFRRQVGDSVRVEIPNVYRIRHTEDGRDFDLEGRKGGRVQ